MSKTYEPIPFDELTQDEELICFLRSESPITQDIHEDIMEEDLLKRKVKKLNKIIKDFWNGNATRK